MKKFDELNSGYKYSYGKTFTDVIDDVSQWAESIGYSFYESQTDEINTFYLLREQTNLGLIFNTFFGKVAYVYVAGSETSSMWKVFWPENRNIYNWHTGNVQTFTEEFKQQFLYLQDIIKYYKCIFEFLDILNNNTVHNHMFTVKWNFYTAFNNKFSVKYTCKYESKDFTIEFEGNIFRLTFNNCASMSSEFDIFRKLTIILGLKLPLGIIDYLRGLDHFYTHTQIEKIRLQRPALLNKYRGAIKMKKFGF